MLEVSHRLRACMSMESVSQEVEMLIKFTTCNKGMNRGWQNYLKWKKRNPT